ncbi:hypothetical protein BC835DRAFT_1419467 [Cytidiella melzeri]|nr:hypothetical protein BC835DRAFT_1419467 [Cytidiella melzeri]
MPIRGDNPNEPSELSLSSVQLTPQMTGSLAGRLQMPRESHAVDDAWDLPSLRMHTPTPSIVDYMSAWSSIPGPSMDPHTPVRQTLRAPDQEELRSPIYAQSLDYTSDDATPPSQGRLPVLAESSPDIPLATLSNIPTGEGYFLSSPDIPLAHFKRMRERLENLEFSGDSLLQPSSEIQSAHSGHVQSSPDVPLASLVAPTQPDLDELLDVKMLTPP